MLKLVAGKINARAAKMDSRHESRNWPLNCALYILAIIEKTWHFLFSIEDSRAQTLLNFPSKSKKKHDVARQQMQKYVVRAMSCTATD